MTVTPLGALITMRSVLVPTGSMTRPSAPTCSALVSAGSTASAGPTAAAEVPSR